MGKKKFYWFLLRGVSAEMIPKNPTREKQKIVIGHINNAFNALKLHRWVRKVGLLVEWDQLDTFRRIFMYTRLLLPEKSSKLTVKTEN